MTDYPTIEFRPRVILSTYEIDILIKKWLKYMDTPITGRRPVQDILEMMIEVYLRKNGIDDVKA